MIDAPIVEFSEGKISGKCCNTLPQSKVVFSYTNIPFAKYDRFEKPNKFKSWSGVRDGTGVTKFQPQISSYHAPHMKAWQPLMPFSKENLEESAFAIESATEGILYLSVVTNDVEACKPVMVWVSLFYLYVFISSTVEFECSL